MGEWMNSGFLIPRVIDSDLLDASKANDETEVGDVGAPVNAASTTTSSAAGVASYLLRLPTQPQQQIKLFSRLCRRRTLTGGEKTGRYENKYERYEPKEQTKKDLAY